MEKGAFSEPPEGFFKGSPLVEAIEEIDKSQTRVLDSLMNWKNLPINSRLDKVREELNGAQVVLQEKLCDIFAQEELEDKEKYLYGASVVLGIDKRRVDIFSQTFSKNDFTEVPSNAHELADELEHYVMGGDFSKDDDVINCLIQVYTDNVLEDINDFSNAVSRTKIAKLLGSRHEIYGHLKDVGKASASIAIAGIIAGSVLRRKNGS